MNKFVTAISALLLVCPALAQQSLLGKYSGSYTALTRVGNNPLLQGLILEITSVEDGVVKGKGVNMSQACRGEYPLEGTLKGNELELRATQKGGPAGDCGMTLKLTVDGNKLVGTMGKWQAQLSK